MCGICGSTAARDASQVELMNARLKHRGPDDGGVYVDRQHQVALGARRLSIIDLAGGHQPLCDEQGVIWAVMNGEIYNYPALRERLLARGHTLASACDTEVLVHLYQDYGPELVHALDGMYAFAIWDQREQRLLLARDRFGEKPLFYWLRDGALTFASELTALLSALPGPPPISARAVRSFFEFGYIAGPKTVFEGPLQLPPGHVLIWSQAQRRLSVESYWSPPRPTSAPITQTEALDEFDRLLDEAVRSRLVADVPVGVFLSGGLDSTLVAAIAATHLPGRLMTFSVGYDVGRVNETASARLAAAAIGSQHHEVVMTEADVARRAPSVLGRLDQPLADQALVASHAVSELARSSVKVALGGEGADELFGGYPRYRWLRRAEMLEANLPDPMRRALSGALGPAPAAGRLARLKMVLNPMSPQERNQAWLTLDRTQLLRSLQGPALAQAFGPSAADGSLAAWHGAMHLDQTQWLPDDVLFKADRASMLVSLESRNPFLERRLAELACSLPSHVHLGSNGKTILRGILARRLPESPWITRKTAFRVPAAQWLRGALAPVMSAQIERGAVFAEGWFDREAVHDLFIRHRSGREDWTRALWPVLSFSLWLEQLRAGRNA